VILETLGSAGDLLTDDATADTEVTELVLLGDGEELPHLPGAVVLATSPPRQGSRSAVAALVARRRDLAAIDLSRSGYAVIAVDDELPLNHALHTITTAVAGAAPAAGSFGDLFSLANTVAAVVGGAVAVEDPQRRILAYSTLAGQRIDEPRQQGILGRQVPEHETNDATYRELVRRPGVLRTPSEGEVLSRLAIAVRSGPEVLGFLWVVDAGSLPADAEDRLRDAAELAALPLLRARADRAMERRGRGEQLRQLLTGTVSADVAAARLGIAAARPVTVLALALPKEVAERETEAQALADLALAQCSVVNPRAAVLLELDRVYLLLPADGVSRDQLYETATSIVVRARQALGVELTAAVGGTADGLHEAARSRTDADAVLRVTPPGEVSLLETVQPRVALNDLEAEIVRNAHLRLPPVEALLEHDLANGTPYAETLLAYLAAQHDVVAASSALAIHQNTFRYRLRRVRELFGLDLDDPDVRLLTWLRLRTSQQSA
jgi:sugar diacid utilization regulator